MEGEGRGGGGIPCMCKEEVVVLPCGEEEAVVLVATCIDLYLGDRIDCLLEKYPTAQNFP